MIIYDLAGHHQYFSSHSACLEAISLTSPAIFLLLQDLRHDPEVMTKEVHYWSTMIDGVCHKCPQLSSVIVVGTHADLLTARQLSQKLTHLRSCAEMAINHQKLVSILALNVAATYSREMDQFKDELCRINKDVVHMSPSISMMCHMMIAFLKQRIPDLDVDAISLSDLIAYLAADPDKLIDPDSTKIVPILQTLSEKGLILFIPSEVSLNSWIVLRKESILKKVNGALFADPSLKEYIHVASNTGIVPRAVIKKIFPEYNVEMITQFMIHFELCQVVELSQVDTNMESPSSDLGPLLFFPALVNVERPSSATVPNNSFGWSMIVKSPDQFFTTRCLHVLLRRLPSKFALPAIWATPLHSNHYKCDVWSRGIKWLNETGVTTIVEMSETFQSLTLAMFSPDRESHKYVAFAHAVLAVIKTACQEFCPHLEVLELISYPSEASSDHSDDAKVPLKKALPEGVELSSLKKALIEGDKHITDVNGEKYVVMKVWMKIEPYLPYLVGVNPPVVPSSSSLSPSDPVGQTVSQLKAPSSQLLSGLTNHVETLEGGDSSASIFMCNLKDLMNDIASKIPAKWRSVGIQLELPSGTLDSIEEKMAGKPRACLDSFEQVFTTWERQGPSPYTWNTIIEVLREPAVGEVALADELEVKHLKSTQPTHATQHPSRIPTCSDM
eukprot:Em0049g16a